MFQAIVTRSPKFRFQLDRLVFSFDFKSVLYIFVQSDLIRCNGMKQTRNQLSGFCVPCVFLHAPGFFKHIHDYIKQILIMEKQIHGAKWCIDYGAKNQCDNSRNAIHQYFWISIRSHHVLEIHGILFIDYRCSSFLSCSSFSSFVWMGFPIFQSPGIGCPFKKNHTSGNST